MANKSYLGTLILRPLLFLFLCFSAYSTSHAQKLSKFYTSSLEGEARLYFIEPDLSLKNPDKSASLVFDLTYSDTKDSIRFSYSLRAKQLVKIDSIVLVQNTARYHAASEKLYISDIKKEWMHRHAAMFQFNDLKTVFSEPKPFELRVYTGQDSVVLTAKNGSWKKQSQIVQRIFELIDINRK